MLISELSRRSGASRHRIRYYEKFRLIAARGRRDNNYRDYDDETVYILQFIDRLKELGFTLNQIKDLLRVIHTSGTDALGRAHDLLVKKRTELDDQIKRSEAMRDRVDDLLRVCARRPEGKHLRVSELVESVLAEGTGDPHHCASEEG